MTVTKGNGPEVNNVDGPTVFPVSRMIQGVSEDSGNDTSSALFALQHVLPGGNNPSQNNVGPVFGPNVVGVGMTPEVSMHSLSQLPCNSKRVTRNPLITIR